MMDVFCKIIKGEVPSKTVFEDSLVKVIMDVNPRSCGHCLVIPKEHYQDIYDINEEVLKHIVMIARRMGKKIGEILECDGVTFEQNNGIAEEVKHFHVHIIPRYERKMEMNIEMVYEKIKKGMEEGK